MKTLRAAARRLSPRSWRAWVVFGAMIMLLAAASRYLWRATAPTPPMVDTAGFDPAVTEAIRLTRAAVVAHPRSAVAWGRLGMVFFAHDLRAPAADCLRVAEQMAPRDARWPYLLGHALRLDQPMRAVEAFTRAAALAPRDVHARLRAGETLLDLDRPSEARNHFSDVLRLEPGNPAAALGLAKVAMAAQQWEAAHAALDRATADPSTAKPALRMLVLVQQRLGDATAARATARRIEAMRDDRAVADPLLDEARSFKTGEKAWLDRVDQLNAAARFPDTLPILEKLAQDYPNSARVWLYLGTARSRMGDKKKAESAYRRSLELSPDSVEANNQLGVLLAELRRHEEAVERYRKVLAVKPNLGEAWFNLGLSLGELGRLEEAAAAFQDALRCKPNLNAARIALAVVLQRRGDLAGAAAILQEAVAQDPTDERARKALRRLEPEP